MKYLILFIPVIFSTAAQILVKLAAGQTVKSTPWLIYMGASVVSYGLAFVLYSIAVRYFPISIASPVNTLSVMVIVFAAGILLGELVTAKQYLGVAFGVVAILLITIQ